MYIKEKPREREASVDNQECKPRDWEEKCRLLQTGTLSQEEYAEAE